MIRAALLAASLLATPTVALAEGVEVTIDGTHGTIPGTLVTPEGDPAPVVLLLHGFGSGRDELASEHVAEGVFTRTAAALSEAGYASLRIDFRGSGANTDEIDFAGTTFEGQVADALDAIDHLAGADAVDGDVIHIIGWSQGGLVAAAAAGRSDVPTAVALWNAVADPTATFGAIFGADVVEASIAEDAETPLTLTLPWGVDIVLNGAFFDGVATFDPPAEIAGYSGALLTINGSGDALVDPESGALFLEAHSGSQEGVTLEMDHVFNIFGESETLDAVIATTIGFFGG